MQFLFFICELSPLVLEAKQRTLYSRINEIKIDFIISIVFLCARTRGIQLNTSEYNIGTLNHSLYVDIGW